MVKHFDAAFHLRDRFPASPVLLYALGMLFNIRCPADDVGRIAQSCLTQSLLCEPGAAQKAFALLSYWRVNGFVIDANLISGTINRLIMRHESSGFSSDVSWALAFCLAQNLQLDAKAGKVLSTFDDGFIALQALHMYSAGLLPKGSTSTGISKLLKNCDLDRENWLFSYEALRQGFLTDSQPAVAGNPLFSEMHKYKVTFYRTKLPSYASVVHPGGAPDWVVRKWMDLSLPPQYTNGYKFGTGAHRELSAYQQRVLDRVRALPGVESAAFTAYLPLSGADNSWNFVLEGRPAKPPGESDGANYRPVGAGYFETIGIPLVRGRSASSAVLNLWSTAHRHRSRRMDMIPTLVRSGKCSARRWSIAAAHTPTVGLNGTTGE